MIISYIILNKLEHNKNLVLDTEVIGCPYSDHDFVICSIKIDSRKPEPETISSKSYSEKNLKSIEEQLLQCNFSEIDKFNSSNEKWELL